VQRTAVGRSHAFCAAHLLSRRRPWTTAATCCSSTCSPRSTWCRRSTCLVGRLAGSFSAGLLALLPACPGMARCLACGRADARPPPPARPRSGAPQRARGARAGLRVPHRAAHQGARRAAPGWGAGAARLLPRVGRGRRSTAMARGAALRGWCCQRPPRAHSHTGTRAPPPPPHPCAPAHPRAAGDGQGRRAAAAAARGRGAAARQRLRHACLPAARARQPARRARHRARCAGRLALAALPRARPQPAARLACSSRPAPP
jgi:hypothetical protein